MAVNVPWYDADRIAALLPMAQAIQALNDALMSGLDPTHDPARTVIDVAHGQFLLMPSETTTHVGAKLVTIAPDNPARELPRIQAIYTLFDSETLAPIALLDGTAVTSLRTPAVSAVAARHLAVPDARTLLVYGAGPQAAGHIEAMRAVRPIDRVAVIGRNAGRTRDFATSVGATVGTASDIGNADIIICATTASTPVFDSAAVSDRALVIAVGSHEPDKSEIDTALMRRATVVVEERRTALREAGDVILAGLTDLIELADVVRRPATAFDRPRVFKSVGMSWQDLVIAAGIHRRTIS